MRPPEEGQEEGCTSLAESFNFAFQGIVNVFRQERNMKIHFIFASLVLIGSLFLRLTAVEVALLFTAITFVLLAELMNSAVEYIVDNFTNTFDPIAKAAKDAAAGAVLVAAVNSVIVGYLLIFNKTGVSFTVFQKLRTFPAHITFIVILITSLLVIVIKAFGQARDLVRGGMPSGHAATAFAVAVAIAFVSNSALVTGLVLFLAVLVSQSRIQARIHSPSEVIVGAVLGAATAIFFFQLFHA